MIALQYARYGEPADVLAPVDLPIPPVGPGTVRLRLLRSPIHNHDLSIVRGLYGVKPELPAIGGSELVGIVDDVGDGVTKPSPGQRVAAAISYGVWAEYVVVPAAACVPIPDTIVDDVACQLLAMPLSALVLLDELRVEPDAWIVQNAAAGAVGKIVDSIGTTRGINVVNLVRRESTAFDLRALGTKYVVATETADWPKQVRAIAGGNPIARIIDSVCDESSMALQRLLGTFGEYVIFGALGNSALRLDPGAFIFNEINVRGFWMSAWMKRATAQQGESAMRGVFALALAGKLPLPVAASYPLKGAKAAVRAAELPGRLGKILLTANA
jgi:NADPH:quinone reductase-like Zn-dependent oxidoreductase